MARLMSVAFTEDAVRDRTKTVTRRAGWWENKKGRRLVQPGDRLTLCKKVMGRKKGEPLERICDVEVVSVRRERLDALSPQDVVREGFPHLTTHEFIERYFVKAQGIEGHHLITRVEWAYLCDSCEGTGRWPWLPFQQRHDDTDDQECGDCAGTGLFR